MAHFHFTYDLNVSLKQRLGFELAAAIWSQFLLDDVTINLHIVATDSLNDGQAVGGAVPLFHEQNYGVYQKYLKQDASSSEDSVVIAAQQDGNTVDVLIGEEVVDGNSTMLLTSAQAKALGMEESIQLENGKAWDRDLVSPNALDGYILINNSFDWSYDFTREADVPENNLDFLTMALHEIGHALGFVSGLDGLLDRVELYSGEAQAKGFTALDLLRYTDTSQALENPDGAVADLTVGADASFSLDGKTNLATFSTGRDTTVGGDGYQASHWERFKEALGIMDPTLGYQERTDISRLDLQAFDVLGWDINYDVLEQGLDLEALYLQAQQTVAEEFGVDIHTVDKAIDAGHDWITLMYGRWWQALQDQMIELGYGRWWQDFEQQMLDLGYGRWWQAIDTQLLDLGYGRWWQAFEEHVLALGHGHWWQDFEQHMSELGYGRWWQAFEPQMMELSYGRWWQEFEQQMLDLGYGRWWQEFEQHMSELGYGRWWQAFEEDLLELGYGRWWQIFEEKVIELGYGRWWQDFEANMSELGYGRWWQAFELGYGRWWQELDPFLATLESVDGTVTDKHIQIASGGVESGRTTIFYGGSDDDIIAGDEKQDRINAGNGDDLLDGKEGHDVLWGEGGRDLIYGHQGNDFIYGGGDDDLLLGEEGEDTLHGEAGHDILSGGQGDDILSGGDGRDALKGGAGRDVLSGDRGSDRLDGETGQDIVIGGEGQDQVNGGSGHDLLYGDAFLGSETLNQLRAWLKQAPLETSGNETIEAPANPALYSMRVEAEDMTLSGNYILETWSISSGSAVDNTVIDQGDLAATTVFDGPSGNYMVLARYYDRDSSVQELTFSLNGALINTVVADQNTERFYTQTVAQTINLNSGDTWAIAATSDASAQAAFDYLEFVPLDNLIVTELDSALDDGPNNNPLSAGPISPATLRVEAEHMTLAGDYDVAIDWFAWDNELIQLPFEGEGKAFTTFRGDTGFYDIVVGYHDDHHSGTGQISTALDGIELDAWQLDQNLALTAGTDTFMTRTVASGITLSTGDIFELAGLTGEGNPTDYEATRIDYVDFIKVAPPTIAQDITSLPNDTLMPRDYGPIRVEAEAMELAGDYEFRTSWNYDSGDTLKVLSTATGTTTFTGLAGNYMVVARYHDEDDAGNATLDFALNGTHLNHFILDQDTQRYYTRTVAQNISLTPGDVLSVTAMADGLDNGNLDYLELVPLDNLVVTELDPSPSSDTSSIATTTVTRGGDTLRVEAESMLLVGDYAVDSYDFSSGGQLIEVSNKGQGKVLTTFAGKTGFYDIVVGYHDENDDGIGQMAALLDGIELDQWSLNQNLDSRAASAKNLTTRTIARGITLSTGNVFELMGLRGEGNISDEFARIDYVEFIKVGAPIDDIVQGGSGNDIAFGGGGNDVIYGETQQDISSVALAGSHSYNDHTYLLSAVGAWEDAQAEAQQLGGNLVTINDADEQIWLSQTFGNDLWIGLNEIDGESDVPPTGPTRGIIEIDATYNDTLVGGGGQDTIYGNAGDDTLYGDDLPNESDDSNSPLTDGLVAHWTFDDPSDSIASDATGNHAGSLIDMGSNPWTSGPIGGALTFDGKDDYVEVPDSAALDITDTLTLATWIKADSFEDWDGVIIKGEYSSGYGLDLKKDGKLAFWANYGTLEGAVGEGDWKSKTKLKAGDWHHVAVTYDGSEIKFYIDGQLETDNVSQADLTFGTNDESLIIGADLAGGSFFEGAMDDARVYDRALDAVEISMLANPQYAAISSNAISENGGSDRLIGGVGNDTLMGGVGNDTLNGTDAIAVGFFETDTLGGGTGADTFILGDSIQSYYQGMGDRDYALIQDFNSAEDWVQLHGSTSNYSQQQQGSDLHLYYTENGSELVAIFEKTTAIDLTTVSLFV